MTSRGQCPRGGVLVVNCVKFRANQPLCPPNQSVPIRLCSYTYIVGGGSCVCVCVCVCVWVWVWVYIGLQKLLKRGKGNQI